MSSPSQWQQVAWMVEFENGAVELWLCSEIDGTPSFGDTVTPLYAMEQTTSAESGDAKDAI